MVALIAFSVGVTWLSRTSLGGTGLVADFLLELQLNAMYLWAGMVSGSDWRPDLGPAMVGLTVIALALIRLSHSRGEPRSGTVMVDLPVSSAQAAPERR